MSEFQLDMNLNNSGNSFKDALNNGNFVFLAECNCPDNERYCENAAERLMPLAEMMTKQQDLCGGLAITDLYGSPWSAVELGAALPENMRNNHCYFLSGCNRSADKIDEQLNIAGNAGIMNLVCVTGNAAGLTMRECKARNFCGSTEQLKLISRRSEPFFAGCLFCHAVCLLCKMRLRIQFLLLYSISAQNKRGFFPEPSFFSGNALLDAGGSD